MFIRFAFIALSTENLLRLKNKVAFMLKVYVKISFLRQKGQNFFDWLRDSLTAHSIVQHIVHDKTVI